MNKELEAAKKRGYIIYTTKQKASRFYPYTSWCQDTHSPVIAVQITGKTARAEMDLIFLLRAGLLKQEQLRAEMYEAIKNLYQTDQLSIGVTYNTIRCKTAEQAEKIAQGYLEIYKSIVLPTTT